MNPAFGKTQIGQIEESAPAATPAFLGMAMQSGIADSDFRTYVLLCQLAYQEHPQAASPWTERTHAELAVLHPEHRPVCAETVRGRLYRLARAGLITRERSGRNVWRTYPVLDGSLFTGVKPIAPHHAMTQPQDPIHLTLHLTVEPDATRPQVRVTQAGRVGDAQANRSGRARGTHPDQPALATTPPVPAGRAEDAHPERSDRAPGTHPEPAAPAVDTLGVLGEHTQATPPPSGCAPGTHPDAPHTRVRARVSTDFSTDLTTDDLSPSSLQTEKELDQSVLSTEQNRGHAPTGKTGVDKAPTPAAPSAQEVETPALDHPVLEYLEIAPAHAPLAVTLATLAPEGMNYEGIEECLKRPELTQTWLDYVTAQGDEIRKPAAYIRRGVRSGRKPNLRSEQTTPATRRRRPARKPNAFERMAPDEYTLWPFDAGEWRKPDPSLSDEAFAAWVRTHDPETVRPKYAQ